MSTAIKICIVLLLLLVPLYIFHQRSKRYRRIDWQHVPVNALDGWLRWYCYRFHRLSGDTLHLPEHGGAIVAANHFSGLDGILLVALSNRPLRFLVAEEEYRRFGVQWLFRAVGAIPVARESRPERAYREAVKVLRQGEIVALFPHGAIHLDHHSPRKLKAGVVRLSALSGCPVLPVRLDGVRAKGSVLGGFFLRGNVRAKQFDYIYCDEGHKDQHLANIAKAIEKPENGVTPQS
jgi:1-acyl-sn-glycerol-3-phosphate acyltransferase